MDIRRSLLLAAVLVVLALDRCSRRETRRSRSGGRRSTLALKLRSTRRSNAQAAVRDLYGRAAGYAVFTVTKGGFIVSGGGGNGVAVNKATGQRTYMRMGTGGIGLGIGGQRYGLVMLFENRIGSPNSWPEAGTRAPPRKPPQARKASRFTRALSTASRSTRSRTKASWPKRTSPARSSGSTTSCASFALVDDVRAASRPPDAFL